VSSEAIGALVALNCVILSSIFLMFLKIWSDMGKLWTTLNEYKEKVGAEISGIKEKLVEKKSHTACEVEQERCFKNFDRKLENLAKIDLEIKTKLEDHRHEGINEKARVIFG
jgi:hypothetical protein